MRIPETTIEKVKETVRIEEVIGQYVTLKYRNGRYWGLCPFHHETDGSFSVSSEKGLFYCFGCHKGGTVFNFIQEIEHCSFPESVELLAKKAGIPLEIEYDEKQGVSKRAFADLYARVANSLHYILKTKKEAVTARDYLVNRGFTWDTLEDYQIGWAPSDRSWLWKFLHEKNFSEEFLNTSGLFSKRNPKSAFFAGRIVFPITNSQGEIIGFGGRIIEGNQPKYINSSESNIFKKGENLYGLYQAVKSVREEKKLIIVEGYTDVLALHQAGIKNTAAPLGTAFTEKQAKLIRRYADTVYIMFDGDSAGVNATKKLANILEDASIEPFIVEIPENSDPCELLKAEGSNTLHNLLKYPISVFDYLYNKTVGIVPIDKPEGKEAVTKELFTYISHIQSEVKKESYLKELSERLEVNQEAVLKDFSRKGQLKQDSRKQKPGEKPNIGKEVYLMIAVAINHEYYTTVRSALQVDDLEEDEAKLVYIALEECYRKESLNIECLLQKIDIPHVKQRILEGSATGEFAFAVDELIQDGIKKIKEKSLERKRKKITDMIKKAEKNSEPESKLTDLLSEKMHLDKELENLRVTNNVKSAD